MRSIQQGLCLSFKQGTKKPRNGVVLRGLSSVTSSAGGNHPERQNLPSASTKQSTSSSFNRHCLCTEHQNGSGVPSTPQATTSIIANDENHAPPILLLEGDQYQFSTNGIARSLYQVSLSRNESYDNHENKNRSSVSIEELYDIERACKCFIIRESSSTETPGPEAADNERSVLHLGSPLGATPLMLQEIPEGDGASIPLGDGPGTGSRTWESSIAMSMFFASHPELLNGDCIEIGSGVGLGGMLSYLFRSSSSSFPSSCQQDNTNGDSVAPFRSLTLTDHQEQVLKQCQENLEQCQEKLAKSSPSSARVEKLDWYDFVRNTGSSLAHSEQYDTVLACDCAYLYPDLVALCATVKGLSKRKSTSKIHIFGPSNRGGLHRLLQELRKDVDIDVLSVEEIDMVRYRLDPIAGEEEETSNPLNAIAQQSYSDSESGFCSKSSSHFIHLTCSLALNSEVIQQEKVSMFDID